MSPAWRDRTLDGRPGFQPLPGAQGPESFGLVVFPHNRNPLRILPLIPLFLLDIDLMYHYGGGILLKGAFNRLLTAADCSIRLFQSGAFIARGRSPKCHPFARETEASAEASISI